MSNEIFELVRAVFILFFLCFSIYTDYKQRRLIDKLRQKVISQCQYYEMMSALYQYDLTVRDELIKAHDIGVDDGEH